MLLPMSFNSETQTISGIALVVIVGATAWTLSKKAAKLKDNNPETAKTSIVAAKTLPAESSLIASEAVNEANSSNCCLGHQHPAALLPENKGEQKHTAESEKKIWTYLVSLIIDRITVLKLRCRPNFRLGCVYLDYNATTPIFPEVSAGKISWSSSTRFRGNFVCDDKGVRRVTVENEEDKI